MLASNAVVWGRLSSLLCLLLLTQTQSFTTPPGTHRTLLHRPSLLTTVSAEASADDKLNIYLATCIPGLAPVLAEELDLLGETHNVAESGNSAVTFEATTRTSLKALLQLRTCHKILELVASSSESIETRDDIHSFIQEYVDPKELLGNGDGGLLTISVNVVLSNRHIPQDINHSHYTALTIKNALCDVVREMRGDRPSVDTDNADLPLVATIRGNPGGGGAQVSLYRCLHPPGSLHRRGYRNGMTIHKAAMKESMAAGLLLHAGWRQRVANAKNSAEKLTLVDPMAGSGSLVLEAAMMAANVAPGLMRIKCGMLGHRIPPVLRWKSGRDLISVWKELLQEATQEAKDGIRWLQSSGQVKFVCNDVHDGALSMLGASMDQAGLLLDGVVEIKQGDCQNLKIDESCFIVTNPPWGVRLDEDMEESWEALRVLLRSCPPDTEAWVLSGNKESTKHLGLRRSQSMVLQTGQQDLRWIQYMILDKAAVMKARAARDAARGERRPRAEATRTEQRSSWDVDESSNERRPSRRSRFDDESDERRPRRRLNNDYDWNPGRSRSSRSNTNNDYQPRKKVTIRKNSVEKGHHIPLSSKERDARKNSWYL